MGCAASSSLKFDAKHVPVLEQLERRPDLFCKPVRLFSGLHDSALHLASEGKKIEALKQMFQFLATAAPAAMQAALGPYCRRTSLPVPATPADAARIAANMTNNKGQTPLMYACYASCADIARELLQQGADPWVADRCGCRNALHYAAMSGSASCIEVLVKVPPASQLVRQGVRYVNARSLSGLTPLHYAVFYDRHAAVEELLRHDPNINAASTGESYDVWLTYDTLSTPLHFAAYRDSAPVARLLLMHYARHRRSGTMLDPRARTNSAGKQPWQVTSSRALAVMLHPGVPLREVLGPVVMDALEQEAAGPMSLAAIAGAALRQKLLHSVEVIEKECVEVEVMDRQQSKRGSRILCGTPRRSNAGLSGCGPGSVQRDLFRLASYRLNRPAPATPLPSSPFRAPTLDRLDGPLPHPPDEDEGFLDLQQQMSTQPQGLGPATAQGQGQSQGGTGPGTRSGGGPLSARAARGFGGAGTRSGRARQSARQLPTARSRDLRSGGGGPVAATAGGVLLNSGGGGFGGAGGAVAAGWGGSSWDPAGAGGGADSAVAGYPSGVLSQSCYPADGSSNPAGSSTTGSRYTGGPPAGGSPTGGQVVPGRPASPGAVLLYSTAAAARAAASGGGGDVGGDVGCGMGVVSAGDGGGPAGGSRPGSRFHAPATSGSPSSPTPFAVPSLFQWAPGGGSYDPTDAGPAAAPAASSVLGGGDSIAGSSPGGGTQGYGGSAGALRGGSDGGVDGAGGTLAEGQSPDVTSIHLAGDSPTSTTAGHHVLGQTSAFAGQWPFLCATTPRGGSPPPRGGTPPPRGGSPPPRGGTPPPRGGSPPPYGSSSHTRGGSPPPRAPTMPRGAPPKLTPFAALAYQPRTCSPELTPAGSMLPGGGVNLVAGGSIDGVEGGTGAAAAAGSTATGGRALSNDDDDEYDATCNVCFARPEAVAPATCRHGLCATCAGELCRAVVNKPLLCPFCRQPVSDFVRVRPPAPPRRAWGS